MLGVTYHRVLKEFPCVITRPMFIIGEKWWHTGKVPYDWKKANVMPIFKKGGKKDQWNCKLLTFTSVIWKITEYVLLVFIAKDVKDKKITESSQHVFTRESNHAWPTWLVSMRKWLLPFTSSFLIITMPLPWTTAMVSLSGFQSTKTELVPFDSLFLCALSTQLYWIFGAILTPPRMLYYMYCHRSILKLLYFQLSPQLYLNQVKSTLFFLHPN